MSSVTLDPKNGRLTASELVSYKGVQLTLPTINAFSRMDAACFAATGLHIWPALPIGGYRSWFVQGDMKVNPQLYGLSTDSTARIAPQGSSTHGRGTRVDVGSFPPANNLLKYGTDGQRRRSWLLAHASEFGFYRELGEADPNHYAHDGFTAVEPLEGQVSAASVTITPIEEDDLYTDADRQRDNHIAAVVQNTIRSGYGHILDEGDLGQILALKGAPHPTRSDYGRLLDLGDLAQLLNVIPAGTPTDPASVAKAILPALIAGLGDRLVSDEDLAESLAPIAEALGKLPDEVRATLKAAL